MSENQRRTRNINNVGIAMAGLANEKLEDIMIYPESGMVQLWVKISTQRGREEVLQYLTAEQAMQFSKAFERCAIAALKETL